MAVDSGVIVNPVTASGQIEGGMTQALGYAVCEEMKYDERGRSLANDLYAYKIFRADEMPALDVNLRRDEGTIAPVRRKGRGRNSRWTVSGPGGGQRDP